MTDTQPPTTTFTNEWGPNVRSGLDAFNLTGKRALIVGADGPAGRAIALAFAEAGATIAVSSITNDGENMFAAKKVRDEIVRTYPGRTAIASGTDVTLGQGVQVMVRQVAKEFGGIDICVCAPDLFLGKPAAETTDIDFNRVMQVNLAGTFHVNRAVGKEFSKAQPEIPADRLGQAGTPGGRIINIASTLGERGLANAAAYCAAQAGILNLTRALAQEWGPQGITVNAIAQGWMEHSAALAGAARPGAVGSTTDEAAAAANQTVRFVPMKRAGRAEELAPLALWLASEAAGYVSGQILFIDGGLTTHL